jgi:hypothetical protein
MTEFASDLRHRCRNPKCRMKLPAPVSNDRDAFCCRTCYEIFYTHRCRVCECTIQQPKRGQRIICRKSACRNAWKAKFGFGRYLSWSGAGIRFAVHAPMRSAMAFLQPPVGGHSAMEACL